MGAKMAALILRPVQGKKKRPEGREGFRLPPPENWIALILQGLSLSVNLIMRVGD